MDDDSKDDINQSDVPVKKEDSATKTSESGKKRKTEKTEIKKNDKQTFSKSILGILRDIAIAAVIVIIIMAVLYAYSGVWPPPVVVESQSMSHNPPGEPQALPPSQLGVIDGGDMVIVKKITSINDITTYIQGQKSGYSTYGSYGDVIIYQPPIDVRPDNTPVIHRAVMWIEYNTTTKNSWDIPEMHLTNKKSITIQDYGYNDVNVTFDLSGLIQNFLNRNTLPHSGFITMGDHNAPYYDQEANICPEPVEFGWIVGVARGELPWFGAIKLWFNHDTSGVPDNTWYYLVGTILVIILIPVILDYIIDFVKKKRKGKENLKKEREKPDEKGNEKDVKPPEET